MNLPDSSLAPLPGAQALFRILSPRPVLPMPPTGGKSRWNSDYPTPRGHLRKREMAE